MRINQVDFFEKLTKQSKTFLFSMDLEGKFFYMNQAMMKKLGLIEQDFINHHFLDFIHPDFQNEYLAKFKTLLDANKCTTLQIKCLNQRGLEIEVKGSLKVHEDSDSGVKYIIGTLIEITDYQLMKEDLERKNKLREIHYRYLIDFYKASIDNIDLYIHLLLSELGRIFQVDRAYIFDYIDSLEIVKNTHEWCNDDIIPVILDLQNIPYHDFIEWHQEHKQGKPIFISDVYDISHGPIRDMLIQQEIKSLITYPIMDEENCVGFIGFDSVKSFRTYTMYELEALKEFSQLLLFAKKKVTLEQSLKTKEDELISEKFHLSNLLNSSSDMILEIDLNKRYKAVYGKSVKELGFDKKNYLGKKATQIFGKDGAYREAIYDKVLKGHPQSFEGSLHNGSQLIWFQTNVSPIYDQKGDISGAVAISRNITDQKNKEKEIIYMNQHDYLTGLHNRRYFNEQLKAINQSKFYPLGFIMMDLNGLKLINDVFGHEKGDLLLKKVSKAFLNVLDHEQLFRVGGDEFIAIVKNADHEILENLIDQIKLEVDQVDIEEVKVSIGIGYAIKDTKSNDFNEILNQAESKMYQNKMIHGKHTKNKAIMSILKALTEKNSYEKEHSIGVSKYSKMIGLEMKLSKDSIKELELAGLLHDIGKISISDEILLKPGKLTPEEYEIIKTHAESGYQILRIADHYSDFAEYALSHHERYDGNGYPSRLKGENIPLFSRIISVADAFEAMTSKRPYREAYTKEYAVSELKKHSGTQFDPKIVKHFIKALNINHNEQ